MSTLAYVRMLVDIRLRQQDTKNRSYSTVEVDQAVRQKYVSKLASLPPAHVAESAAFTIAAGGDTFTVTLSGTTYSDALDVRLQLASTGQFLRPRTVEELDAMRGGHPTVFLNVPTDYALWQTHVGTVLGRCYPGALVAQSVNMFRSRSHTVPTSATDLDSAAVYFNEAATTALAAAVAADLLLAMPDKELERRRLARDIASAWKREADTVFYQEEARRNDLESIGRTQRWVP